MLRGSAYCLIDEASGAVLKVSGTPLTPQDGCIVRSVQANQLPPEVQALAKTPTHYEIEAAFIGGEKAAYLADDPKSIRIEMRDCDGDAAARQAEILARRLETMEPVGLLEAAIVGLVRLQGAEAVARAVVGTGKPQPAPKAKKKAGKKVK